MERRLAEPNRARRDIIRCLKRHVARELYPILVARAA
jgi:hypothetical protein